MSSNDVWEVKDESWWSVNGWDKAPTLRRRYRALGPWRHEAIDAARDAAFGSLTEEERSSVRADDQRMTAGTRFPTADDTRLATLEAAGTRIINELSEEKRLSGGSLIDVAINRRVGALEARIVDCDLEISRLKSERDAAESLVRELWRRIREFTEKVKL